MSYTEFVACRALIGISALALLIALSALALLIVELRKKYGGKS